MVPELLADSEPHRPGVWATTLTRPSDDSCRSICTDARCRISFHLDSAPASRCTDSECTAAYCGRITRKLRTLAPGTFSGGSLERLPSGGWIPVPSRTAGLVKESPVLPYKQELERPRVEFSFGAIRVPMLFAKFIVGSNVVSLLAGQAGLSAARFLIYDSIGSLTWSGS